MVIHDNSSIILYNMFAEIKNCTSQVCWRIVYLQNHEGVMAWKLARITPIYKGKGDISRECNYRPISVLPHVAKLFERRVCMQLLDYLESNDMITPLQSAYLKKHSTVTCLHKVVDDFCEMIDDGDMCGICFLDIEKCFDTIHHGILLQKLEYYGIQGYALQWFKQYLTDRTQCVRLGNSLSDIKPISIGVPQGSVLGPILFLLYVNDLPQHIKNEQCNMFADDTIIYSSGQSISEIQSKLQMAIDSVIPWYESNRLAVNTEKSSVMLIGKKTQIRDNNLNIYINNVLVNETNCTKYLGLFIDTILSWDVQCDNLCRHISGKIAVLRRIRSFIKPSIMKVIYDRTIQPVIDYGCSVWYNTTSKNLEKLQKVQNYAARIISGNFDYINVRSISLIRSLKWMTISERCEYLTAMLMFKAINGLVPNYLSDSIVMAGESHDRDTRLSESLDVHIPSHNSSALKRSFIYNGSVLWNALPEEIKASDSIFTFKKRYKEQIIDPLLEQ